jgi:NADPH:quinone reductase
MKAVVVREFGPIGHARVEEVGIPVPAAHEVLIEIAYAPANLVDTLVLKGEYQFLPARPFTPGKGPVGTVKSVGRDVTRFRPGDRVLAMAEQGGYAQFVCADQEQCYGLPEAMTFEAAAAISLAYDTAWFALVDRARMVKGERVLVLGATGAVGSAAVQLARAKGAYVIGGVSSPEKAELALQSGCDATIDLSRENLRDSLREQVHALTDGKGADIVIDPLGGDFFDAALRAVAWRGRLVVIGFAAGRIPTLKANYVLLKNIEVSGLQVSDYRKRMPDLMRACFEDIFDLYLRGALTLSDLSIFELDDYAQALTDLQGRRIAGRAVLKP